MPRHVRPGTLHTVVLFLWIAVGTFTGLGIAAAVGTIQLLEDRDLDFTEYIAAVGSRAGPFFVAAVVALGALAVVESVLVTLGHVEHIEEELEPPRAR